MSNRPLEGTCCSRGLPGIEIRVGMSIRSKAPNNVFTLYHRRMVAVDGRMDGEIALRGTGVIAIERRRRHNQTINSPKSWILNMP